MLKIRKSEERGKADHGWLKSYHTFSFASYFDRNHMGFRSLRVINEDKIAGGAGFDTHPHRDMEIISYVIEGALEHQDSMGNKTIIWPGEVQKMSAGTGVEHSEYNHIKDKTSHLLQIWIKPKTTGAKPSYGQKSFEEELNSKKLVLVVSNTGRDQSLSIDQDVDLYLSRIKDNDTFSYELKSNRHAWVQLIKGSVTINNNVTLNAGDAVNTSDERVLNFKANENSELLLFDLS